MRTRTPIKRGEMEAVNVILCLGGFPNASSCEQGSLVSRGKNAIQ